MKQYMKGLSVSLVSALWTVTSHGAPALGQGTWETTLQARDLDGNGSTDAFYDTALNITWLADRDYFKALNPGFDSKMEWSVAEAWANTLAVGPFKGWRLPSTQPTTGCTYSAAGGTDCGANVNVFAPGTGQVTSEIAHLWYVTLANRAYAAPGTGATMQSGWGLSNTGPFKNLDDATIVWSSTYPEDTTKAWMFDFGLGTQNVGHKYYSINTLVVHNGDLIAQVPEPAPLLLVAAGLMTLVSARKRSVQLLEQRPEHL